MEVTVGNEKRISLVGRTALRLVFATWVTQSSHLGGQGFHIKAWAKTFINICAIFPKVLLLLPFLHFEALNKLTSIYHSNPNFCHWCLYTLKLQLHRAIVIFSKPVNIFSTSVQFCILFSGPDQSQMSFLLCYCQQLAISSFFMTQHEYLLFQEFFPYSPSSYYFYSAYWKLILAIIHHPGCKFLELCLIFFCLSWQWGVIFVPIRHWIKAIKNWTQVS